MTPAVPVEISAFLGCPTPEAWVARALDELDTLLLDHANCEMKAAASALALLHRYPERRELVNRMSRLAREELRHFEQVQRVIDQYGIERRRLGAGRYAVRMLESASRDDPERLRQRLVIGAFIEARSCERFACLAPRLPSDIGEFYVGLLASESRHFSDYLALATAVSEPDVVATDVERWRRIEADLVTSTDTEFRFHSGVPVARAS